MKPGVLFLLRSRFSNLNLVQCNSTRRKKLISRTLGAVPGNTEVRDKNERCGFPLPRAFVLDSSTGESACSRFGFMISTKRSAECVLCFSGEVQWLLFSLCRVSAFRWCPIEEWASIGSNWYFVFDAETCFNHFATMQKTYSYESCVCTIRWVFRCFVRLPPHRRPFLVHLFVPHLKTNELTLTNKTKPLQW